MIITPSLEELQEEEDVGYKARLILYVIYALIITLQRDNFVILALSKRNFGH